MAKADLSKTTFSNTPTQGLEVPDVYDEDTLKKIANPLDPFGSERDTGDSEGFTFSDGLDAVTNVAGIFKDTPSGGGVWKPEDAVSIAREAVTTGELPAVLRSSSAVKLIDNSQVREWIGVNSEDVNGLIRKAKGVLPPGASLSDLTSTHGLVEIVSNVPSFKEYLSPTEWLSLDSLKTSSLLTNLSSLATTIGGACSFCSDVCGAAADKADKAAGLPGNSNGNKSDLISGSVLISDLTDLVKCGLTNKAFSLFDDSIGLFGDGGIADEIADHMGLVSAGAGAFEEVSGWFERSKGRNNPIRRRLVLREIMLNYRLPRGTTIEDYKSEADSIVVVMEGINSKWEVDAKYDGLSVRHMRWASRDLIKVLTMHPDYWHLASTARSFEMNFQPKKVLIKAFMPNFIFLDELF